MATWFRTEDEYFEDAGRAVARRARARARADAAPAAQARRCGAAAARRLRAAGGAGAGAGRQRLADREAAAAGVVHELRHERRDALGGGRGLGYTTPNERFFVRDHTGTPMIDAADLAAEGVRQRACAAAHGDRAVAFSLDDLQALPRDDDHVVHRVRRQRAQLLRAASRARRRAGHAVGARRGRRRALARRAARGRARARRRSLPARGRRDAGGARQHRASRTASTPGTCAGRSRSRRRSTTRCSPTR